MQRRIGKTFYWFFMILAVIFCLAPFYISIVYSFKTKREIALTGVEFPRIFHLDNYAEAVRVSNFLNAFKNSLIVTVCMVIVVIVVCSMAAYVISRVNSRFFKTIYYIFLAAIMMPFQVIMLPLYINLYDLGLMNTLFGMILTMSGISIPYTVFIYTGFIKTVPRSMEEAAYVDGAGKFRAYWQIVFPLLKPINFTALIINALSSWNNFMLPLIIAQKEEVRTLPLSQFFFFGQHSSEINLAFAAFTLSMIPIIILYLIMQKYIVAGITSGAVKG